MNSTFPDAPNALDYLFAEVLAEAVAYARRRCAEEPASRRLKVQLRRAEEALARYADLLPGADQVVPVDQLGVQLDADQGDDLLGVQPGDAAGVGGGVVAQPAGELGAGPVAQGDDIPLAEVAPHAPHPDRQHWHQQLTLASQRAPIAHKKSPPEKVSGGLIS